MLLEKHNVHPDHVIGHRVVRLPQLLLLALLTSVHVWQFLTIVVLLPHTWSPPPSNRAL
jgi:hypothetical protein